jgi:hypothetical protein
MVRRPATGGATAGWLSSRGGATGGGGATRHSSGGSGRGGGGSSRGGGGGSLWRSGPLSSTGATRGGGLPGKGGDTGSIKDRKDGGKHKAPKAPKTNRREKKEKNQRKGPGKNSLKAAASRALRASTKPDSTPRRAAAAFGHGTTAAWRATAPVRHKAAAATARQAKRLTGATRDGLRSILSGAWTWLRTRDCKAALGRLKDVWRRHRTDRHTAATAPATPTLATTVRRPATTTIATTGGPTAMSGGHHFIAPAMEAARIAATYDPKGMLQVGEDFAGLEEALRLHAEAMKATVENADAKQPLDPRIVEIMRQIHQMQIKAAEMAAELRPAFEKLHDVDLTRLRNPRKGAAGERMWDVASNL